jgi:hypothetical protein
MSLGNDHLLLILIYYLNYFFKNINMTDIKTQIGRLEERAMLLKG